MLFVKVSKSNAVIPVGGIQFRDPPFHRYVTAPPTSLRMEFGESGLE
jgi:hypothetical protein|tara:strand:- start:577 stop:717 length:141 start_codon:yes stop_codon:yes gene_type:complete